ncbi:LOW QUALITY PROTEIN: reverse transcriptase [Phytophthora megakarya]|uniref:Reverse transcriptase n=1 Tax=Phytophthora megakarya TaxID=4795 RepID=A0A225VWB6_9STRA|nr:LOW QUALITY PROTEIN: reverse transcriptase [Phytophthora megakarya]
MDLLPGESRGYWKHHSPGKWFCQAKITGKIHNEKTILLLDTGAEVSVDTAFARKIECYIDPSQIQDCVGIGDNTYRMEGRTRIKVTLAGSLVYFFDIWVADLTGQQAILGMDFMVPARIRLDLAHGSISLRMKSGSSLAGDVSDKVKIVNVGQYLRIQAGGSVELPLRLRSSIHDKLWITRGDRWVPTIFDGPGRPKYISITTIGDEVLILHRDQQIGIWLAGDHVPRIPGFISIGSRRYMEWQNLALEATTDTRAEEMEVEVPLVLAVERPEYETLRAILQRPKATLIQCRKCNPSNDEHAASMTQKTNMNPSPVVEDQPGASDLDLTWDSDQDYDEYVYYHEGSDLYAVHVDGQMAVLPEVPATTEDMKNEDIQLCGSDNQTPEEIDRLRPKIWKFRHLLIGKRNSLPPPARGVVCDIDFKEKLADLIKGLLSAKMINYTRSPWASPIVVIIKKNGVDIRLCIDYRLANNLTQLMVYPMPLINDLLEDLESTLWYCSLDMASGFWVVKMTDRARWISAFITPFGLFEWNRMPFGLKNAPQIYQRMIDNALYGFTRIPKCEDHGSALDVFEDGKPVDPGKSSVLGRRSYIDDILIPANNWDQLCDRVEGLLEACDKWNLSISVSFWGMPKMEYLGHKVSYNGLEANPKGLSALTDLAFPGSLRAMQSFLGSLNYYSRFIEDYAIYASVLYELREIDFAAMMKDTTQAQIQRILEVESVDQGSQEDQAIDHRKTLDPEAQDPTEVDPRWIHAYRSFRVLKAKIATTPILRHFDPDRSATIVVYASDWAISGSLMQEYDKIYYPVMFASRTLKSNELNYGIAEKEVLALLRILDFNYNALAGRPIHVLTRHSNLAWTLEITNIGRDEDLYVVSFDGSARVKRGGGTYSPILWKLPEWRVLKARSGYAEGLTVNEAEYYGLLLCLDVLEDLDPRRLVICGDSNLVNRQVRGEIDCKAPAGFGSTSLLAGSRAIACQARLEWECRQLSKCRTTTTVWDRGRDRRGDLGSSDLEPVG